MNSIDVWVVAERRSLDHRWAPERWTVVAIEPGKPDVAPGTLLAEGDGWTRWFLGTAPLILHHGESANYQVNLEAEQPAIYAILRRGGPLGMTLLEVTVDPGEIDSHADSGDDLIEALPLPAGIAAWIAAFVAEHHKEQPRYKRRRDRADPEALGRRQRGGEYG